MSKDSTNTLIGLLACSFVLFIMFIVTPLVAIIQGWVLTVLWSWFVVPTFRLPELSIPVAIGLSLIVGMFKGYNNPEKTENEDVYVKVTKVVMLFVGPFIVLFLGWIVTLFM